MPTSDTPKDPQDDTTFGPTADDTTQLEQTMHTETTQRLETTDLFGGPVTSDEGSAVPASAVRADEHVTAPLPERPSGPHAPAIVLGLVCLAVAGIILAQELGSLTVDWGNVGPLGIVLTGAVLVLFGLLGLLSSRRNSTTR